MTVIIKHFDALDYVDQSKTLGVDEKVATKSDIRALEAQIHKSKFGIVIWVAALSNIFLNR